MTAAVAETVKKVNSAITKSGMPPIYPRYATEVFVHTAVLTLMGVYVAREIDNRFPKYSRSKTQWQSVLETLSQVSLLGIVLYASRETLLWGAKKMYKPFGNPTKYATIIMAVAMMVVQPNLREKLENL